MRRHYYKLNMSCLNRSPDVKAFEEYLKENGWGETVFRSRADLVLFFTCSYHQYQVEMMVNQIVALRRMMKPTAKLIVGGCLPKIDQESLARVRDNTIIVCHDLTQLKNIPGLTSNSAEATDRSVAELAAPYLLKARETIAALAVQYQWQLMARQARVVGVRQVIREKVANYKHWSGKSFVVVNQGCRRNCSYCAVKFAVGPLRSRPIDEIVEEVRLELGRGRTKIVLSGDCISDFGLDLDTDFGKLLDALAKIEGDLHLELWNVRPDGVPTFFPQIEALARSGRLAMIEVPIQSAVPRIAKIMHRAYDFDDLRERLLALKRYGVVIKTHIIIGYPTETDEEFVASLPVIRSFTFDLVCFVCYSDMPNTESSKMEGKVDRAAMTRRYLEVRETDIPHLMINAHNDLNLKLSLRKMLA